MTSFDGRAYTGAEFIPPALYHPAAPAVGDVGLQAMAAAYMASRYRGQLVGVQTYPMRFRFAAHRGTVSSTSAVDIAEWGDVHLPAHATHVGAELWFAHAPGEEPAEVNASLEVYDGSNTDTGSTSTFTLTEDTAEGAFAGLYTYRVLVEVALANVTAPDEVRVRLKAFVDEPTGGAARDLTPLSATCWRWTV